MIHVFDATDDAQREAIAAGATRFMGALLYQVRSLDPPSYVVAVAILCLTGLTASWWQAQRASRIQPAEALRAE
jgi:ABC-type antimicrobial peptide transport system permease subunit